MVAFASGGRRRSEIASLRTEQLVKQAPLTDEDGSPLPSLAIHLGRTKTSSADQDEMVYLTGRPVEALTRWLKAARIDKGSVFRKVDRWGNVSARALEPSAINRIVKQRARMAGLDAAEFSAHGLRPAISPKLPIVAFHCLKPWNSPAIDPSSRRPIITTMPKGRVDARQGYCEARHPLADARRQLAGLIFGQLWSSLSL